MKDLIQKDCSHEIFRCCAQSYANGLHKFRLLFFVSLIEKQQQKNLKDETTNLSIRKNKTESEPTRNLTEDTVCLHSICNQELFHRTASNNNPFN